VARARLIVALAAAATVAAPRTALAHATNTGFGPFYDGLAHLLVTPEDLLTVIAIALLAAMQGRASGRFAVFALAAAWLAGTALGSRVAPPAGLAAGALVLLVALGAAVAADRRLPSRAVGALVLVAGLLHGWSNGATGVEARLGALFVAGIAAGVFVLATLVGGQVAAVSAPWARVAVRVAGSWITAIGLLMLGWTARGGS